MTQEAILWTLLATMLAGIHVTIGKITAQKKINSSLNSVITFLFSTLTFSFFLFLQGFKIDPNINIVLLLCAIAGFVYGISFILRIQALHHIDSVLFFPINKIIGPIIAIVGGILLFNETLSTTQIFGVILSISVPLLLINNTEKHRQNNLFLGLTLLFVSTVFGVSQQITFKYLLNIEENILLITALSQFFAFLVSLSILFYEKKKNKKEIILDKENIKYGIFSGMISVLSLWSLVKAIAIAPLSLVYTIHAHYILIPIIFSVVFYKEHIDLRKTSAVVISMIAIAFLI